MKILLGVSGASGAIYAKYLIKQINYICQTRKDISFNVVFTDTAKKVWVDEIGKDLPSTKTYEASHFIDNNNFYTPFASGSNCADVMIIAPSSMGMIGRIANGISDDLITRAADVQLKERKKLIIIPRETPYNLIHLENLKKLGLAGAIIYPASPSFYHNPKTIDELIEPFIGRIIEMIGLEKLDKKYRWTEDED